VLVLCIILNFTCKMMHSAAVLTQFESLDICRADEANCLEWSHALDNVIELLFARLWPLLLFCVFVLLLLFRVDCQ